MISTLVKINDGRYILNMVLLSMLRSHFSVLFMCLLAPLGRNLLKSSLKLAPNKTCFHQTSERKSQKKKQLKRKIISAMKNEIQNINSVHRDGDNNDQPITQLARWNIGRWIYQKGFSSYICSVCTTINCSILIVPFSVVFRALTGPFFGWLWS